MGREGMGSSDTISLKNGAGGGTRTPTWLPTADFESAASAIPPPRQARNGDINTTFRWGLSTPMKRLLF